MSRNRSPEHAVKLVDVDETEPDPPATTARATSVTSDADTDILPRLRPDVLRDAAQRHTRAAVHAALFKTSDEAPTIGAYRVLNRIGEGGMGVVYAAYDEQLARKVALKLIRGAAMQRPEGRARILREARALARVSHPNVVHVYQVGELDDEIFVAMEFLTGPTLRAWSEAKPRTWREVLAVMRQAGEGLAAAHRQGVIHRDFKPANVIVGDDGRVRVLDFGLAHFGEPGETTPALPATAAPTDVLLTQTGAVLGTPAYMAAEQFAGARGDTKTDQFSFCTALYEALHGERPFTGEDLTSLALAVSQGQMQPLKTDAVPAWLHRVVLRGLHRDPAARWPSMDALLAALQPPQARPWRRIVATVGASSTLLLAGAYALQPTATAPLDLSAELATATRARDEATRSHDEKLLLTARAALTVDPTTTIRTLARLTGDDPTTWQRARFLMAAAQAQGIPEQVLRAGDRPLAEVHPTNAGGFLGRDDLGAVWQWKLSERTASPLLPAGAADRLLVARDAPTWATLADDSLTIFGEHAQTITLGAIDPAIHDWRLTPDGRTLVASLRYQQTSELRDAVHLWDLTRPGTPPKTIAARSRYAPVVADDASLVLAHADDQGIRVIDPQTGRETLLPHASASQLSLSTDARFVIADPADNDHALDVIEIATGKSRRVEADIVVPFAGADALFLLLDGSSIAIRREALATGAIEWRTLVPTQTWFDGKLRVDPTGGHFTFPFGEQWAVGDLHHGTLTSFLTVPKDMSPQWVGPGALLLTIGGEARIHRPAASPLQVRHRARSCDLSPSGRWAVMTPYDADRGGQYTRVDLTTRTTATFRCPTTPPAPKPNWYAASASVDDTGQVAVLGNHGWNCWWDPRHGARAGTPMPEHDRSAELPQGVALATATEVQTWPGPDGAGQRWTTTSPVFDMLASPTGAHLAARTDRGLQLLHTGTDTMTALTSEPTPLTRPTLLAQTLAWSPDATRLALLHRPADTLELIVWDVTGEPRELSRHDLKDSPGRPSNLLTFTPAGTALALTDRLRSITLLDLARDQTRKLETPDLSAILMRSETELVAVELRGGPHMADFATTELAPLAPPPHSGWQSRPPLRRGEPGTTWACDASEPGTLVEISAIDESSAPDIRAKLDTLAAAL